MTVILLTLCSTLLAERADGLSALPAGSSKTSRLLVRTLASPSSSTSEHKDILERARRTLATTYPTLDIQVFRRDQTVVLKNTFMLSNSSNLTAAFHTLRSDSDEMADSPSKVLPKPKAVFWGNSHEDIVLQLDDSTQIENEFLFLTVGSGDAQRVYRSEEKVYQYYEPNVSTMMGASIGLAAVFMLFACCCWCCGMRQFYLLIRIPQMLFMLNLLASKPQAAPFFSLMENLRYNLFSVIPNPVAIDEVMGNHCQLPVQFYAEMLSCNAYNSLKNYVLGFLIFTLLYAFIALNKFHDRPFFARIRRTMDFHMFMLAIFPDVAIAIYLNAVAGLTNSVLSLGFLFSLLLVVWYVNIFRTIIGYYFQPSKKELVEFLKFHVFSRSRLTENEPKLGIQLVAVLLDYLKVFIIVTMIALFHNAPRSQMVIVFLAYLFNAVFLVAARPYGSIFQNLFHITAELSFFLITVLVYARHATFDKSSTKAKETGYGDAQAAFAVIVFLVTHFNFIIPMLKGQDSQAIIHKTEESANEGQYQELQGKTLNSVIIKKEPEAEKPHHVDQKDQIVAPVVLPKPKIPERDVHTAEGRSSSKITEGSELPVNKEEQLPMRPKDSENPAMPVQKRKVEIKGMHNVPVSEPKPSEENLLRNDFHPHDNIPLTSDNRDVPVKENPTFQTKRNNLLGNDRPEQTQKPAAQQNQATAGRIDPVHPEHAIPNNSQPRPSDLPPVRAGKVPVRKTFKADVKNQDFEGM